MYIADCTGYYGKLNQLSCCLPLLSLTLLTPYKEKKKKTSLNKTFTKEINKNT